MVHLFEVEFVSEFEQLSLAKLAFSELGIMELSLDGGWLCTWDNGCKEREEKVW